MGSCGSPISFDGDRPFERFSLRYYGKFYYVNRTKMCEMIFFKFPSEKKTNFVAFFLVKYTEENIQIFREKYTTFYEKNIRNFTKKLYKTSRKNNKNKYAKIMKSFTNQIFFFLGEKFFLNFFFDWIIAKHVVCRMLKLQDLNDAFEFHWNRRPSRPSTPNVLLTVISCLHAMIELEQFIKPRNTKENIARPEAISSPISQLLPTKEFYCKTWPLGFRSGNLATNPR